METTSSRSPDDEEGGPVYDGICGHARKALRQISSEEFTFSPIQNEPGTDTYLLKKNEDVDFSIREINACRSRAENSCRAVVGRLKREAVRNYVAWARSDRAEKLRDARAIVPQLERCLASIEAEQILQSVLQWELVDEVFDLVWRNANSEHVQLKDTAATRLGLPQAIAAEKDFKRLRGHLKVVLVARPPVKNKTSETDRERAKHLKRNELVNRHAAILGCLSEIESYPDAKGAVLQFAQALQELFQDFTNFDVHRSGGGVDRYRHAHAAYRQFTNPLLCGDLDHPMDQAPPLVRILVEVFRLALLDGSQTSPAVAFAAAIRAYLRTTHLNTGAQLPQGVDQVIIDARRASKTVCRLIGVTDFIGQAFVGRLYVLARFCCSLSQPSTPDNLLARRSTYCAYLDIFVNRYTHSEHGNRSYLRAPLSTDISAFLRGEENSEYASDLLSQALKILTDTQPPVIRDSSVRLRCYSEAETSGSRYPPSFDLNLLH